MTAPAVSIVIPTRNGAATLPALLDAIDRQRARMALEIVALDSASSDGTRAMLVDRGVDRIIDVQPEDFDHGLTRNAGVAAARSPLVVLLVQDAVPVNDRWLDALTAPFDGDPRLAGTYARQVPRVDASPVTRYYHPKWAAASGTGRVTAIADREAFDRLPPAARFETCIFDNVCSCVRRSVWERYPFRSTPIGEDAIWAKEALLAGFRVAFTPGAVVVHSHDRSPRYELARTRVLHRVLYEQFGLHTIPSLPLLARAVGSSLVLHARCEREAGRRMPGARALALAFAWPLGQYLGARDAVRRAPSRRIEGV